MKNLTKLVLGLGAVFAMSCGDDKAAPDAPKTPDAAPDAMADAFMPPAAPTLGTPIDRMGRPAVNTALVGVLDSDPLKTTKKDNYNHAVTPSAWIAAGGVQLDPNVAADRTIPEFAAYMGVFDVIDQGQAGVTGAGCKNGALYNDAAGAMAYFQLAGVLGDDELYVDTAKGSCNFYLSLEVEVATGGGVPHSQCGGRTLTMDVVDISYSLLAAGLNGFDAANGFDPKIKDGAVVHGDVSNDNFPFLGAAH